MIFVSAFLTSSCRHFAMSTGQHNQLSCGGQFWAIVLPWVIQLSLKKRKIANVSSSSTESVYRLITVMTCYEFVWLQRLLKDLGLTVIAQIPLDCDNEPKIHIYRHYFFHERTKHVELDCHLVCSHVLETSSFRFISSTWINLRI